MISDTATERKQINKRPKIVATIPAYNEERMIAKVVVETQKYVDQVIVVDDGSTDLTAEIAGQLGVKVVRHGKNLGYGAAIKTCLESGYSEGADIVVTIDGDGQHNPRDISTLVRPIVEGQSDLVIGSRFNGKNGKTISKSREFGVKLITQMVSAATHSKLSDAQSGLRAYSRRALQSLLPAVISDGMGVSAELLMKAEEYGLRVDEVPVEIYYETGERTSTKNPINHGGEVILSIIELVAEKRPLVFIGIPGLAFLAVGFVSLLTVFVIFNETRLLAIGTALLSVGSVLIGLLMIFGATILYSIDRWRRRLETYLRNGKGQ